MIRIICGEDTIQARKYLQQLKDTYRSKHASIQHVTPKELEEVEKGSATQTLFEDKIIYITEGLIPHLAKKRKKKEELARLELEDSIFVIDWEGGKSLYTLGIQSSSITKEFKPDTSIFDFLDACLPQNKERFLTMLQKLVATQDEVFIYTLLHRHVRSLIVLKSDPTAVRLSPWQKKKMQGQADRWDISKLLRLYEGLTRIDLAVKTNASPYSISQSIEILACFYL
ncbi:MAG: hypothetical protein ACOCXQ_00870 [Patescibacteria group bacterium]